MREALFSIWSDRLEGARVLDLFAGSGVVGLEALGRGALSALAVDSEPAGGEDPGGQRRQARASASSRSAASPSPTASPAWPRRRLRPRLRRSPLQLRPLYAELLEGAAPLLAADGEIAVEHTSRRELPIEAGPLTRVDVQAVRGERDQLLPAGAGVVV